MNEVAHQIVSHSEHGLAPQGLSLDKEFRF